MSRTRPTPLEVEILNETCPTCRAVPGRWCNVDHDPHRRLEPAKRLHGLRKAVAEHRRESTASTDIPPTHSDEGQNHD